MPDLLLPSQPQDIAALDDWYEILGDRHVCVQLPNVVRW